jgi:hypothetical protein
VHLCQFPASFNDNRAHGNVGGEYTIDHIDMQPINAGRFKKADLIFKMSEVAR